MNKKLATLAIAGTIGVLGLAGAGVASAMQGSESPSNDSLIDRLVEKFNLNKDEVSAVFKEDRAAKEADMKAKVSEKLQKAVDAGKITAEQKTIIETKLTELEDAREDEQAALQAWAKEKGIDLKYLMARGHGNDDWPDDDDLTDEQKQQIKEKRTELQTARESQRDALEQWAEENNIDKMYVKGGGIGFGFGFDGRGREHRDM